jgi:hypothetical protein
MDTVLACLIGLLVLIVILAFSPNFITRPISNVVGRLRGLPAKDPMDWTLTSSSSEWNTGEYCINCKGWTNHADRMSGICHQCGSKKGVRHWRSARKIWDGRQWCVQFKYGDGANEYTIESWS